jgi:hypothetical protein
VRPADAVLVDGLLTARQQLPPLLIAEANPVCCGFLRRGGAHLTIVLGQHREQRVDELEEAGDRGHHSVGRASSILGSRSDVGQGAGLSDEGRGGTGWGRSAARQRLESATTSGRLCCPEPRRSGDAPGTLRNSNQLSGADANSRISFVVAVTSDRRTCPSSCPPSSVGVGRCALESHASGGKSERRVVSPRSSKPPFARSAAACRAWPHRSTKYFFFCTRLAPPRHSLVLR